MEDSQPVLVVNGWSIFLHPIFKEQLEELITCVEGLRDQDPVSYKTKNATKRLAAIRKLAFDVIPADPALTTYRQGNTLGKNNKHWFRAKFFQQYRLFFRYHKKSKIIVYVWVNDTRTKRAYNSKSDAYQTFRRMLESGHPPNDFDQLLREAKTTTDNSVRRFLNR